MVISEMEIRLRADIARLQRDMDAARQTVTSATNGMARAADAAKSALAGIGLGMGMAQVIQMTDQYTKFTAQLRLATLSTREYNQALASVKAISTAAQTSIADMGVLYAKIANGTRELGNSQKQIAEITEVVGLGLKVSGATAQEASSAMLQLSQAFASGVLRGEEFNAVNEAGPRVMLALAEGIGVPVGALKKMAEEGKLTSDVLSEALPRSLQKLREEAKEVQTISGAFQVLKDRVMEVTAVRAKDNGSVAAMTQGIELLADNLSGLLTIMTGLTVIKGATWAAEWVNATHNRILANKQLAASAVESASVELRRAEAERQSALIAQSRAREGVAAARAEVAADRQRMASAAAAAEAAVAARLTQFTETAAIIRSEIALEKTRLAAQINGIGRAARVAEMARLATQLDAVQRGMAASSAELTAVRVANENAAAAAAAAGAAKIAAAREAEVVATGGAAAATLRMRLATAGLTTAIGAASVAGNLFRGGLALLGGPIGAVITLLTIGGMAWMTWGNKAEEANDKVAQSTEETTKEMIERLDKQIEKLRERNRLAETEPRVKEIGELNEADTAGLAKAKAALDANRAKQAALPSGREKTLLGLDEIDLLNDYEVALQRVRDREVELQRERENNFAKKEAAWRGQYGTAAEKEAYELEKLRQEYGRLTPAMIAWVKAKVSDKGAASQIKQEQSAYQNLVTSVQEKIAANELELSGYDKLTESQKMTIKLDAAVGTGKSKLSAGHVAEARALIDKVAAQERSIDAQQRAAKWAEIEAKNDTEHYAGLRASTAAIDERIKQLDREIEGYGLTTSAAIDMEKAKLEAKLALGPATYAELIALDEQIKKMEQLAKLARNKEALDAGKKAADQLTAEWKRQAESIEQSLTDALLRGFESGKGFGKNLIDTIKNMFSTLVLRPIISAVVNPVTGAVTGALGIPGAANAATGGGGGIGGAVSTLGTLGSLTSGVGLLGAGGLGLQAGFGALMSSGLAGISGAVSGGIAAIGAGTASSIAAGIGTIAGALGPIALGIGAAVAIWKKFDTSGTSHTGGASLATSAGTSTIKAESIGFQHTKVSSEVNGMTAQLASGIVSILDSTALAFGKTAGYSAATAFADDTSKDGAWGALVIQKMGQDIIDWNDTRQSKWAPREFADGEKGQEQYLGLLSRSVRTALDGIGLPDWARTMLNGIASDASLEDLAKVVEQINATQSALSAMRAQLVGFSSLSDTAVSALMAASGGIDKLFSNASAYYDAFYTEAEKNASASQQIAKALATVNLQMPASRDGFRALVEAQMKLGAQGAEAVSVLLGVAGAFAQVTPEGQAAIVDLDSYRAALTEAYNAESQALQATISRMGSFASSLRELRNSALLGSLSPLSPSQKYAEAKSQYEAVLAAARGGDESAQGRYQDAYTAFLEASRVMYASSNAYRQDFDYAQAATEEAAKWAETQVDVGQAQLDSLKASVSGLIEVNKSVLSVREAIQQLNAAMGKNTAPLTAVAPPVNTPIPYSSYGTSNTEALVAEVKALRTEVAGLRADQNGQTGALIAATRGAGEQTAGAVSSAVKSAAKTEVRVQPE